MHICRPPHGSIDTPSLLALALLSADGSHPGSLCGCTAESRHCSAATLHPSCSPRSSSCSSRSSIFTHAPHPAPSIALLYITSQALYARARAPPPLHVPSSHRHSSSSSLHSSSHSHPTDSVVVQLISCRRKWSMVCSPRYPKEDHDSEHNNLDDSALRRDR